MILLIIVIVIMCIILVYFFISERMILKKTNTVLEEIKNGNLNRRFLLRSSSRKIANIFTNLNHLIDKFQKIHERKIYLEELRIRMISDISHDLRTPLTSMLGYIEALQNDISISEEEKARYIDIINQKASSLYSLLDDYFYISKLEEETNLSYKKVDITERIRQVFVTFYHDFIKNDIEVCIDLPDESVWVLGDEGKIERILQNLLSNALKYGKDGKTIGINLRFEEERIWIDVWDRGRGIPQEDIDLIFERLYTVEASRNQKLRGTGLGLSIVKKLVEKMDGEIYASSIPYEKTIFSFYLKRPKSY